MREVRAVRAARLACLRRVRWCVAVFGAALAAGFLFASVDWELGAPLAV